MMRKTLVAVMSSAAMLVAASSAAASYTLDGAPVDEATALKAAGSGALCQATEPADGVNRCFSSSERLEQAFDRAASAGALPPGYTAPPSAGVLARRSQSRASAGERSSASAAPVAARACSDSAYNHIFTGANKGGTYGYYGYSPSVQNFQGGFYKGITSFQHYFLGAGYYAGSNATVERYPFPSSICDNVSNMASAHPEWDNRFASVITAQAS